ncbi:MAG: MATE family efflux transporter [Clostridium sp.]|nr:MATE family efflux transporter [Clostridium sp.]
MNKFKKDFTSGNSSKLLRGMVIPIFFSFLLNIAYNIIDTLWVGNLIGTDAVASLTISYPIILLLTSIAMGGSNGAAILISKYFGAKDDNMRDKTISTSIIIAIVSSLIITVICIFLADKILNLLNAPNNIYGDSKSYLITYLCGFIFTNVYLYLSAIARSLGNSLVQVEFLMVSSVLNIILDPVFIKLIGGVQGAALATVISQGTMVLLMILFFIKHKFINFNVRNFDVSTTKIILCKSIPSIIQQCIPAVSTSFITSIVSGFGISAIAGFGICGKVEGLLVYPAMALNMGITVAVGQCMGAGKKDKAKEYLYCGLKDGIIVTLVLSILVAIFSKNISGAFLDGEEVAAIVRSYFLIILVGYVCNAITNSVLGTINGSGNPSVVMYFMIFYYCIVRMPLAKILSNTSMGIDGVWVAVLVSHFAAMLTTFIYYKVCLDKKVNKIQKW